MTRHTVSDTNPTYVTGADRYRIPFTGFLTPDNPQFTVMEEYIQPEHRRSDGYGLAFLESEEHHVLYIGSVRQLQEYRTANTDGTAVLDPAQGVMYAFWPHGKGWDDYIPNNAWNPGGEGIVTEFDHPLGGKVTVYEYLYDNRDGEKVPMVGFHCDRCHPDPKIDHEASMPNRGPQDRRWSARNARVHIRSHADRCRPVDPRIAEVVQQVANEKYGVSNPTVTWESRCATTGPCARIRHLRARS
ncbi:hypothetical protein [Streptomyces vietnamensis]|uniref:Uncharacterized protein n=1 Tax=Streptomyces vietnamensis TaxID=362257 RepID=A0A0B5ID68_9ACTN|nr:hypothetical protein [Streptomyces vietnamensis]AJF70456.1 hypothetical protein SVTN_40560 [Streptomyces vietnamensis]